MPTLEGIKEFLQVVESGSFSKASDKLGLSNAQVSRMVSRLEGHLGVKLLYRSTRNLSLTDEGKSYYDQCRKSLDLLENIESVITSKIVEPSGTLKVNLSGWFQEKFLVPIALEFIRQHPKLDIEVTLTDKVLDPIAEGYDVAICGGHLEDSNLIAQKISSSRFCVCASPGYLEKYGTPESLEDLKAHNCLTGTDSFWELSQNNENFKQAVSGNWKTDNANAILAACIRGAGLAHLPVVGVDEYLQNGQLTEVLTDYTTKGIPVWILYPSRNHMSARVKFFMDYLKAAVSDENLPEQSRKYYLGE